MASITTVIHDTATRMQESLPARFKHAWYIISAAASTATPGQGQQWLPEIYRLAVKEQGPANPSRTPSPLEFEKDSPRRQIVRQLKDTLIKSAILVGVGGCIESGFALSSVLEEGDHDETFVRSGFENDGKASERGKSGLERVYQHNLPPLDEHFKKLGLHDNLWMNYAVTYGTFLRPTLPEYPAAALTFSETEIIITTCLMARHAHREVGWHLRGCLRSGMTSEEVESCQQAIDICLQGLTETVTLTPQVPLPRVVDVKEVDDLS